MSLLSTATGRRKGSLGGNKSHTRFWSPSWRHSTAIHIVCNSIRGHRPRTSSDTSTVTIGYSTCTHGSSEAGLWETDNWICRFRLCFRSDLTLTSLAPPSRFLLVKLVVPHVVKKFTTEPWTQKCITAFTGIRQLLSWSRLVPFTPTSYTSLRSILILFSHWRLGYRSGRISSGFHTKFSYEFKGCKSVHHRTIQINHQPDTTIFQFIILTFIYSSTCFGRSPAHHQELNDCSSSLWFYFRIVMIAVLCTWSGRPARPHCLNVRHFA